MSPIFRGVDLVAWFEERYPLVKAATVRTHITCATVNLPSRRHCYRADDLLFKRPDGSLERYDAAKHGLWRNGQLVGESAAEPDQPGGATVAQIEPDLRLAQALGAFFAAEFYEAVLSLPQGLTHRFDFAGDAGTAGIHVDKEAGGTPGERWKGISEAVWLLQKLEEPGPRFVIFTRDGTVARMWLGEFERLCPDVEFLFVDGETVTDLKGAD